MGREEDQSGAEGEIFYLSCVAAPSPKMSTLFYEMSDGRSEGDLHGKSEWREESSKKTSLGRVLKTKQTIWAF